MRLKSGRWLVSGSVLCLASFGADTPPLPPLPNPDYAASLTPGQLIEPIDLASALRLVGARDLDVAIARERVIISVAELDQAKALWLPSLFLGPQWVRHDGQAQVVEGTVRNISKSSLFVGGSAAAGSVGAGPVLAGGPANLSGLTSVLRFSDAIFEPLAARQSVVARKAGVNMATNDALLGLAEAYFDLQQAAGRIQLAREAVDHAEALANLTRSYAKAGAGLEADYRRALVERDRQQRAVEEAVGQLEVASAELVRRTRLDPRILLAPIEPPVATVRLLNDSVTLDELIPTALTNRPELAQSQAFVKATLVRLKQARLRPLIPSLALQASGGGFGGGKNDFFGAFNTRGDVGVNLFWTVQNMGATDHAIVRARQSEQRVANLELFKLQDRVASEVVAAHKASHAATRQLAFATSALPEAKSSVELNLKRIKQGAGLPLEALQPIQALAVARREYLDSAIAFNRAQFRLFRAIGQPPLLPAK